ncbi:MAG: MoaD/ThiS family protein [Chloroflexi bacterium]|nr:MoaD/ThiS family protein [Chloroflexota bacterium]MCY3939008.1 MoaD/ThiS family protein [Chloroflexota bacterium]
MADVYIPAALRRLTGGERVVTVAGETVGDLIDAIDKLHSGVRARLVNDGRLRPGLALSIDGDTLERGRLGTRVRADSKVYFILATSGGASRNCR